MKSPILGSAYVTRSSNVAYNEMVNLFPEVVPEGGKEPAYLSRTPGLRLLAAVGNGPVRGMHVMKNGLANDLFVASGDGLYRIASSLASPAIFLGTIYNDGHPVSMADNGTQLFVACNGPSYIYNCNTNVFGQITDPDFTGAVTVGYLDGFFVYNEPDSQKIWVTALLDGTSIDPLDFASAEASPDRVKGLIVDHRELWIFGENSTEVWYNAGTAGFPFAPIQGAFTEVGCASPYTLAKMDNTVFWLSTDARGNGIVYRAKGYTGERISTHSIEWQIQQYTNFENTLAYTYQQDGHAFYVLIFPDQQKTWVYDAATGAWHERAGYEAGAFTRHRGNCQAFYDNLIVIGDYERGSIYAYDLTMYVDNAVDMAHLAGSDTLKWVRTWRALPTGANNLKRTVHHSLQLDCETGIDSVLSTDELSPMSGITHAVVTLRWSDDGGHTWSNPRDCMVGGPGETAYRVIWRRLGMTTPGRDRIYEISGVHPVKVVINGAELVMSPTNA